MNCNTTQLPYIATGYFSKIVTDYLQQSPSLRPFYQYGPTLEGIKEAINTRQQLPLHRSLLSAALKKQYSNITTSEVVHKNIELLQQEKYIYGHYRPSTGHFPPARSISSIKYCIPLSWLNSSEKSCLSTSLCQYSGWVVKMLTLMNWERSG